MTIKHILFALVTVCLAVDSSGQDQECVPPCRSGYFCQEGTCFSRCNPPCPDGFQCNDDGECEFEVPSVPVTESMPDIDFSRHYTVAKFGRLFHSIGSPLSYGSLALTMVWLGLDGEGDELIPVFAATGGTAIALSQFGVAINIMNARKAFNKTSSSSSDRELYKELRLQYIKGQAFAIASLVLVTGTTPLGYNTNFGASVPFYALAVTFMILKDINWMKMNNDVSALLKDRANQSKKVQVFFDVAPTEQNGLQYSFRVGIGLR